MSYGNSVPTPLKRSVASFEPEPCADSLQKGYVPLVMADCQPDAGNAYNKPEKASNGPKSIHRHLLWLVDWPTFTSSLATLLAVTLVGGRGP
jgi:hypothetical protein